MKNQNNKAKYSFSFIFKLHKIDLRNISINEIN